MLSGIAAYIIAIYSSGIYDLVEAASSFGTAGILVITIIGLLSKKIGHEYSALVALIVGLIATPVSEYVLKLEAPFMTSILCSFISFIVVELFYQLVFKKRVIFTHKIS